VLRASKAAETAGVPSVTIVGSEFMKQAAVISKGLGMPLAVAQYPGAPMLDGSEAVHDKIVDKVLPEIIRGLTLPPVAHADAAPSAEPRSGDVAFRGTLSQVQNHYHGQLWSDGLPIIPPTRERVAAFLRFTGRGPDASLGVLPQEGRRATIHSIAVNGVMAGCRPEYMPLLVAAVEAICDPFFKVEEAGSTTAWEPLPIISGPIIEQLDFNYGAGVMKVGRQANSSVGRFLRLYLSNICGYRIPPGAGDKGSIGYTFNVALAENETCTREIGWPTFAQDCGFEAGDSVVTVQSAVVISSPIYSSGDGAVPHLQQFVDVAGQAFSYWAHAAMKIGYWHPLIVIGPSVAKVIGRECSKDDVRRYFWERATMSTAKAQHYCRHTSGMELDFNRLVDAGMLPPAYAAKGDPDRPIRMVVKPEHIGLVVAGDPGRNQSRAYMGNHMHGARTSRRVVLPPDWDALLRASRETY
jgi:hypothetical protein